MEIRVRNKRTGVVYSNDMSEKNEHLIVEILFFVEHTTITVQDKLEERKYRTSDIIIPPFGAELVVWRDVQDVDRGEWVNA